ncbi:MAG: DUF4142 domain-containing protein [Parvibaculum sp.]
MLKKIFLSLAFVLASAGAFAQDAAAPLNDARIAHIAYTAGQIDISAANLALEKSEDAQVLAFAELMARDHAAVNEEALALLNRLDVAPQENDTSAALSSQAREREEQLAALAGREFDIAYVENEVTFHKTVNEALQNLLIPNAQNADLKALLETGLSLFREHQLHAEHLLHEMN